MRRQVRAEVDDRLRRLADRLTPVPVQESPARSAPVVEMRTWSMRAVQALVVLGIALAVIAAYLWWQGRARDVTLAPPAAAAPLDAPGGAAAGSAGISGMGLATPSTSVVVDVSGAVRTPGVITVPAGSRVTDAITAAGGALHPRDLDALNLARPVVDGEQIMVGGAAVVTAGKPSVNAASLEQLDAIAGVGPVLAQRILDFRTAHGPFTSLEQLDEVSGVGQALLARLREALSL